MARPIKVLNLSRSPLRIGNTSVPPAKGNPTATTLDLEDGKVRKRIAEEGDRLVVVPGFAAAIADLNTGTATTAQIATAVNSILAVLRANGTILP